MKPKAAVIQMTSSTHVERNLVALSELIKKASSEGASLVVLPEMFPLIGLGPTEKISIAEIYGAGIIQTFLEDQAKFHDIWIVAGTIPIKTEDSNRVRAACIVYNNYGKQVVRYDKIHLFDVCVEKGVEEYKESSTIEPGDPDSLVVVDTPIGKLGLAVCYDLRFPVIFQSLMNQGAEIIAVPSAFTVKTGKAHWEILVKARCIETLCYGLFADQVGTHSVGRASYGHSMIINPWGETLALIENDVGVIVAEIDLEFLKEVRTNIPILAHQRAFQVKQI
jgi:nitrilase